MAEIFQMTLIGIVIIYLGYRARYKGDISLVHRYHYKNLKEEDKEVFCSELGKWEIVVGVGCVLIPYINIITASRAGDWIGFVCVAVGIIKTIMTIIKYNGSLF